MSTTAEIESLLSRLPSLTPDSEEFTRTLEKLWALEGAVLEPALAAVEDAEDPLPFLEVLAGLKIRDERIWKRLLEEISPEPEGLTWLYSLYGDPRAIPLLTGILDGIELELGFADDVTTVLQVAEDLDKLGADLTRAQIAKVEAAEAREAMSAEPDARSLEELSAALDAAELEADRGLFSNEHILVLFAAIKGKGGEPTAEQKLKVMRVVGFRNLAKAEIEKRVKPVLN